MLALARTPARMPASSQVATLADLNEIRYAQCWEDADVLLTALDVRPGDTCVSIASAGDNTLALLTRQPGRVVALDLSAAQLACLELRVAGYRTLTHPQLLELIGSWPSARRPDHYRRCRPLLSPTVRAFWDARPEAIAAGIGAAGKFERYLALFRERMLPLVHNRGDVSSLLAGGPEPRRTAFYEDTWDTWRWRLLFRIFFSRAVMGRLGRDPSFFSYVEGHVAARILERTRYALTALNPAENPYVDWILTGAHPHALPYALRPEHFESIRAHLDRLEWHQQSLEDYLARAEPASCDRFNLSDIFEYMAPERHCAILRQLARAGRPGARLVYWNMLAPRCRPSELAHLLRSEDDLAERLHRADKAFFYRALIVEEVV